MSRSGYTYDEDELSWIYRGSVERAIRGKRGQRALVDFVAALDAMPAKELISNSFSTECGVCALGALAAHRRVDMSDLEVQSDEWGPDIVDAETVGDRLDIAPSMAREVMFENDEAPSDPNERWAWMRRWAVSRIEGAKCG